MSKKLDFPSHAICVEETDFILYNKYLKKYFFYGNVLFL